jgi:hypothetical protein
MANTGDEPPAAEIRTGIRKTPYRRAWVAGQAAGGGGPGHQAAQHRIPVAQVGPP